MTLARCELLFLLVNLSCVLWALLGISLLLVVRPNLLCALTYIHARQNTA